MICAIYLRKSRADLEAEARGEGETLARHEHTLMELAHARKLTITAMYRELVSGDTIADRPEMQRLLADVERRMYDAVLCMDIDRLGRGDGADQSTILKTCKYADTIIITPYKTYDPRAEMDEEFMEYAQFMARGEYKRIKRRMWAGRVASAKEGKWQSPKAPFGYRRVRLETSKGWTLTPEPSEAEAVRSMFQWYAKEAVGKQTIANRINAMGFRTQAGKQFEPSVVWAILHNPVYIGKVRWCYRKKRVDMIGGEEVASRPRSDECFISDGLHPAILDVALWEAVQHRLNTQSEARAHSNKIMRNPLSGLMVCACCGRQMVYVPEYGRSIDGGYRCRTRGCPTSQITDQCVYDTLLNTLRRWVSIVPDEAEPAAPTVDTASRNATAAQLAQAKQQLARLQDLLETGVYNAETYLERSKILTDRIKSAEAELARLDAETKKPTTAVIAALRPKIQNVLDVWDSPTVTPAQKNTLLKSIISKIVYHKTAHCYRNQNPADYLTLDVFPVI